MNRVSKAILSSLTYSSLFSSSLSLNELYAKLHTDSPISFFNFTKNLKSLINQKIIYKKNNFYNITNKFEDKNYKLKLLISKKKYLNKYLPKIISIPFVKAVFLTGSLSAINSQKKDDIDLMLIVSSKRLWLTRFLINLKLNKVRRHPKDNFFQNKLCFNIFIEEDNLKFPQNIYIANEIIQAQPIFLRGNIYQKLLKQNLWIKKYFANAIPKSQENNFHKALSKDYNLKITPLKKSNSSPKLIFLDFINFFSFLAQYIHMKPKITHETIHFKKAFFHPDNLSQIITKQFQARKNSQNLLK